MNPGGSLKNRPVKFMLADAISKKLLTPYEIILDSSSGDAGISYGMIGAEWGIRLRLLYRATLAILNTKAYF